MCIVFRRENLDRSFGLFDFRRVEVSFELFEVLFEVFEVLFELFEVTFVLSTLLFGLSPDFGFVKVSLEELSFSEMSGNNRGEMLNRRERQSLTLFIIFRIVSILQTKIQKNDRIDLKKVKKLKFSRFFVYNFINTRHELKKQQCDKI